MKPEVTPRRRIPFAKPLIAIALVSFVVAACQPAPGEINTRVQFTLATPTGPVQGESVLRLHITEANQWYQFPESRGVRMVVQGEAPVVVLADGRAVALPIRQSRSLYNWLRAVNPDLATPGKAENLGRIMRTIADRRDLRGVPADKVPLLAVFPDPLIPNGVIPVEAEYLTAALGPGYEFSGMTIQVVDLPVTTGTIPALFPWATRGSVQHLCAARGPVAATTPCTKFLNSDFLRER